MFGGGKGGGNPLSQVTPTLHSLRVQTSAYGQVLPVVVGTARIPGKLLDDVDFTPIAHTSVQNVGGKGGGGGQKQQTTTTYTYTAAVVIGLCVGRVGAEKVRGIGQIWDSKGKYSVTSDAETFVLSPSHDHVPAQASTFHDDRGAAVRTTTNVWVADWDEGSRLPDNGGMPGGSGHYDPQTTETPLVFVAGAPGPGQYSLSGTTYIFNAAEEGKTITIHYTHAPAASDGTTGAPTGILNFTVFNGDFGQSAWSYMVSKHPDRALGYSGTAYVANEAADLGTGGNLENYGFEVYGLYSAFGAGILDASVDNCIRVHLALNGWDTSKTGDLTDTLAYTASAGIFFSPVIDAQRADAQLLQDIVDAANLGPVWSEGVLKFIPYGDRAIAGNGHAYTPNLTPVYDLDDDDFIAEGDEPAVTIETEDPETTANQVKVQFRNRKIEYNNDVAPDQDAALVFRFGAVPEQQVRNYPFICDPDVAGKVANHRRLRIAQIDPLKIHFRLGWQYERLEPMDLVTLTVKEQGWIKKPVRLVEGDEDPSTGVTSWTAEDFPWGTAHATLYPKEAAAGSGPDTAKDPGSVEAPVIFEPPDKIKDAADYDLWIGVTGQSADWGGATIWSSKDGATFKQPFPGCRVAGKARMGTIQTLLPVGIDHDVTNTIDVDLAISAGELLSGTNDDRDTFRTLCYIEGAGGQYELISYKTATLVSGNRYHLTDLRRGVYGTPILSHAIGKKFLRLDDAVLKLSFGSQDVGATAHLKFTSFNTFGAREQSLADVTDYTHALGGIFNNSGQIVSNNAKVDSIGTGGPPFTAATVRVYLRTGVSTDAWIFTRADETVINVAAQSFPGLALSTAYFAMYNPLSAEIYLLTTYRDMIAATALGHIHIGDTVTPDASGAGGQDGGGGGSDGGGGEPGPGLIGNAY
jgi:hypothetical protein